MIRLTYKVNDTYYVKEPKYLHDDTWKLVQVLGQYEDVDEKLGISIITLFKACTQGFYIVRESPIKHFKRIGGYEVFRLYKIHGKMFLQNGTGETLYFKDYGKTWALTKEELK